MIWNLWKTLQTFVRADDRKRVAAMARRWQAAQRADEKLAQDLIELGEIMIVQPAFSNNGNPMPTLPDATTLAYAAGRRDMALQLLALMNLSRTHIHNLMKDHDDDME